MKKIILFAALVLFIGCASSMKYASVEKLKTLQPGISMEELSKFFDNQLPYDRIYVDGNDILAYPLYRPYSATNPFTYAFVFKDNKLIGWHGAGSSQRTVVTGVNVNLPIPSRE